MVAVALLVPESRASHRHGLDPIGMLCSCSGLTILVYGFIAAGQYGWSSPSAITAMVAGTFLLAVFAAWDLRLTRRPGGQPLVPMGLFQSARFSWGAILAGMSLFAMYGLLFAGPQFFQAILGVNAMGSGLRLLPMMGGLAVGTGLSDIAAKRLGAKLTVALGFAILTAGVVAGATMTATAGNAFIAGWTATSGLGFGLVLATAASAALTGLPDKQAGVGSAVMQTIQKAGAPLSAAILGSVLNAGYRTQLHLAGLPAGAAATVRSSVFAGIAVARTLDSPRLLESVRAAFAHGIGSMLWVSAGLAAAGGLLALAFLPWHATQAAKRPAHGAPASRRLASRPTCDTRHQRST